MSGQSVYKAMRLRGYGYGVQPTIMGTPNQRRDVRSWGLTAVIVMIAAGFVIAEIGLSVV